MTNIKGTVFNIVKWLIYALLLVIIFMLFLNFFDSFYKGSKLHVNMTGEGVRGSRPCILQGLSR